MDKNINDICVRTAGMGTYPGAPDILLTWSIILKLLPNGFNIDTVYLVGNF